MNMRDAYDLYYTGTVKGVRDALAGAPRGTRAVSLTLHALAAIYDCDTRAATTTLRRALRLASTKERAYIVDLLIVLRHSTGDKDEHDALLREANPVPDDLASSVTATESLLRAVRGDVAGSKVIAEEALSGSEASGSPLSTARVLSRCATAAYYRADYCEARDLAMSGAALSERVGAHTGAMYCYTLLASIADDWTIDASLAGAYWLRAYERARRVGHEALTRYALCGRLYTAAECAGIATYRAVRRQLFAEPSRPQYREHFFVNIAEALGYGWDTPRSRPAEWCTSGPRRGLLLSP